MPTSGEKFSKGYEGGKNPARSKVRPQTTKTVATVHPDGSVTASGPEAPTAKREAEASVKRVTKVVKATKTEERNRAVAKRLSPEGPVTRRARRAVRRHEVSGFGPEKRSYQETGGLSPSDFLDAAKAVVKTAQIENPGGKDVRQIVGEEAKNLYEVGKENLSGKRHGALPSLPTSKELQAAGTLSLGVAGEAGVASDVASSAKSAVAKAAEKASTEAARKAEEVRTAPARLVKTVRNAPTRAKELPADVRKAVETPAARKATAKATGKTALRHPIRTGIPAAAIVPPGVIPGDASERARALLVGLARATEHPGDLATATAHGVLGAFTAPLAVSASAIESAKKGDIGPLEDELGTLTAGIAQLGQKLVSGNPKEVEQTFRKELGVTPFIPVPHLLKGAKNSDAVDAVLGDLRGKVEAHRATRRDALIQDVQKAEKEGSFVSIKQRKAIEKLAPVEDKQRGGNYVNRPYGRLVEKQRARHDVSRIVSRTEQRGNYAAKGWSQKIVKALKKSKFDTNGENTVADALRILNKYGIPLDETGQPFIRMLHESYPELKPGDVPAGVHLDRHSTKWLLDHPDALKDPQVRKAVELFDKQAEKTGTSPRNRYLGVTNSILNPLRKAEGKRPILLPEEQIPKQTSDLMNVLVQSRDAHKDPWTRDEVLEYAKQLSGDEGLELKRRIEASLTDKEGNLLMRSPAHGGAEGGVSTTRAVAWTPEMEKAFVDEARKEIRGRGLREPAAYVGDQLPDALKGEKAPNFSAGIPLNKIWPSRGEVAKSGNALSDFENFMHKSVEGPRHRASLAQGLDELVQKGSRKIEGKRAMTDDQARRLENEYKVPAGTVWVRVGALKSFIKDNPNLTSNDLRTAIEGEFDNGPRLTAGEELAKDVGALDFAKGEKLVPMDQNYIHEFLAHMKPIEGATRIAGDATRLASRMILNSPAFALIQPIQEGIPLATALARDIRHVPEALKNLKAASKLDPDELAAFKAASGSSAGLFGVPSQKELRVDGYLDPVRMTAKPEAWRRLWHLVNGKVLGQFDRNRAGFMREVGMEARTIGDLKRASKGFNVWRKSTGNLFKDMEQAVKDMQGMTPEERHAYISEHPALQDRIQKSADGMAGNWNSFTVFEKHIAPLTLFYTFQRYSALWMLYHFPLDHPIAATAMTLLGQVNAKELQKLAAEHNAEPSILDYTMPVYQRGEGQQAGVLPAGKRAFPGLSTVQQAGITGKPTQLLGELPPEIGIPVEAAAGVNSYTGRPLEENLFAFMGKQGLNLNPAIRLFLGLTEDRSAASAAFHAQDPLSQWRSVVDPYIGQTGTQYGKTKKLEKDFSTKYGKGNIPSAFDSKLVQELLYGGKNGGPKPEILPEVLQAIHQAEGASGSVKKAEEPFNGPASEFSPVQKKLLEEVENAWQTGPGAGGESKSSNLFSKALSESKTSSTVNPFSKALSESSSGGTKANPFSAALAKSSR